MLSYPHCCLGLCKMVYPWSEPNLVASQGFHSLQKMKALQCRSATNSSANEHRSEHRFLIGSQDPSQDASHRFTRFQFVEFGRNTFWEHLGVELSVLRLTSSAPCSQMCPKESKCPSTLSLDVLKLCPETCPRNPEVINHSRMPLNPKSPAETV